MTDRENVISLVEDAIEVVEKEAFWTIANGLRDALDLLKEQEEDKPKGHWTPHEPDKRGYTNEFTCSRCKRVVSSDHYCKMVDFDFCPYCGAHMNNAEGW